MPLLSVLLLPSAPENANLSAAILASVEIEARSASVVQGLSPQAKAFGFSLPRSGVSFQRPSMDF